MRINSSDVYLENVQQLRSKRNSLKMPCEIRNMRVQARRCCTFSLILTPSADHHVTCISLNQVVKNRHDRCSLQRAITYPFDKFLDKSRIKSNWSGRPESRGVRRFTITNRKESESCELISYAVNDCLAVTKLLTKMQAEGDVPVIHHSNRLVSLSIIVVLSILFYVFR